MKYLLSVIMLFSLCFCYASDTYIDRINSISGKQKWEQFKQYLVNTKKFNIFPHNEIVFVDEKTVTSIGINHKITTGSWHIDTDKGFLYIELYSESLGGYIKKQYHSFHISCVYGVNAYKNIRGCTTILFLNPKFEGPIDMNDQFTSGRFLTIYPIETTK